MSTILLTEALETVGARQDDEIELDLLPAEPDSGMWFKWKACPPRELEIIFEIAVRDRARELGVKISKLTEEELKGVRAKALLRRCWLGGYGFTPKEVRAYGLMKIDTDEQVDELERMLAGADQTEFTVDAHQAVILHDDSLLFRSRVGSMHDLAEVQEAQASLRKKRLAPSDSTGESDGSEPTQNGSGTSA